MTERKEMTFFEHLDELRGHLFRSALVVIIISALAFIFKHIVFDIIILGPTEPWFLTNKIFCMAADYFNNPKLCINDTPLQLINISLGGQFSTHFKISFLAGIIIGFPYIVFELWKFVSPALYEKEKKVASATIFSINLLFFIGVLIGYFMIVPLSVNFLANYIVSETIQNTINLTSYINNLSSICFASGIVFELPVITYLLSRLGLMTPQFMKKYRKHAIIVILVLAAILTPPDILSQLILAIPMYMLYEFSISISAKVLKRKNEDV